MKMRKNINDKFEEYILVFLFSILVLTVVLQIFFRFVINISFGWSEELARYLLIWIAWIAASYAVHKSAHIRVEIAKDLLKNKLKKVVEVVVLLVCLGFAVFLAVEGTQFVLAIKMTQQVTPSLGIKMWLVYLAVPVGGTLMGVRFIQQILYIFKNPESEIEIKTTNS